tara:strand:+ start:461 stop:751 length:291 start_codon:yes stop_codon:yes gene_type:complete
MGSNIFMSTATGVSAREAFYNARQDALLCNGHGGYTGTIAEKDSFNVITLKEGLEPRDYANKLIDDRDPRISDKWGPAGCFDLGGGRYFFFGLASS